MSNPFPLGGIGWMREVERQLRILGRHNHPDPAETSLQSSLYGRIYQTIAFGSLRPVNSTGVSWLNVIRLIGLGPSPLMPTGRVEIAMPANGTVIPVHGVSGQTTATVASGIIPLANWQTLYYDAPLDGLPSTGFHIVGFNGSYVQIPARWVRLVYRDGTSTAIPYQWSDGYLQDYSRVPTYTNSWADYGNGFDGATYKKVGGQVVLNGIIAGGTVSTGSTGQAFVLPSGWRPSTPRQVYATTSNGALGRVDVFSTGEVRVVSGSNVWVSLDPVAFPYD